MAHEWFTNDGNYIQLHEHLETMTRLGSTYPAHGFDVPENS